MLQKTLKLAVVLFFAGELFAGGFQLGIGIGYGFGAGRDDVGSSYETNSSGGYSEYKDVRASFGNGLKFDIDGTILLNDNVGVIIGTGISILGGYKLEMKDSAYTANVKVKANYLPITVGLRLQGGNGKILPYIYVAPGIYIPMGIKGESDYTVTGQPKQEAEMTGKFALGFGFSSGIGALLQVSNMLGIRFECSPTYVFARLKEETFESGGTKSTTIYKKNETNLPEDTNDTNYEHGAQMQSFSSIAAKIGIVISLGR